MTVFENFTKKVTETAKAAAKKSSELVEVTKLNMSIGTEENKIEKAYAEIGKLVYKAYSEGENVGDTFKEYCEKIEASEEAIKGCKQKILELKNIKVCPSCGVELEMDILFCPKCGTKQEVSKPEASEPKGKVCAGCGAEIEEETAFCTKCGAKMD